MKNIFEPLRILRKIKGLFFVWIVFILIFGQAGILATALTRTSNFFSLNLSSGNFYTFSIALLASSILPFALEWMNSKDGKFRTYKVASITISFLLIVVMMSIFSTITIPLTNFQITLQLVLYTVSLLFSIYFLCLQYLHFDYENYKHLDDNAVNKLLYKTDKTIESDDRGIKL